MFTICGKALEDTTRERRKVDGYFTTLDRHAPRPCHAKGSILLSSAGMSCTAGPSLEQSWSADWLFLGLGHALQQIMPAEAADRPCA